MKEWIIAMTTKANVHLLVVDIAVVNTKTKNLKFIQDHAKTVK